MRYLSPAVQESKKGNYTGKQKEGNQMNKILEKIADFAYNCGKDGAQLPSWREIMSLSFRRSSRKMKKTSKMIVEFPNRRT